MTTGGKTVIIIPARMESSRFPGKPLADLAGKTLIRRVYENALRVKNAQEVAVASGDEEITGEISSIGGRSLMTPGEMASGSDRVYYAYSNHYNDAEIVVNLQGDEPFIDPGFIDVMIDKARSCKEYGLISAYYVSSADNAASPDTVKVTLNRKNEALYFSRRNIPYGSEKVCKHLGVYVWRPSLLEKFFLSEKSYLEKAERLEQLRVLENGYSIRCIPVARDTIEIDTPEDVAAFEALLA